MLDYVVFQIKKALLQLLCNLIPITNLRIKARRTLFEKIQSKVVLLNEVDSHLPKAVLAKLNAYENEYFIQQNAKILPNYAKINAEFKQILTNSNKTMTGGGFKF